MTHWALHLQLSLLALLLLITSQSVLAQPYRTLVAPITKDTKTSLYTITLSFREKYVIDLDSPLLWHRCNRPPPPTVSCTSPMCTEAHRYASPSPLCPSSNGTTVDGKCTCLVTPFNPVSRRCAINLLTYSNLIIFWTNGRNPTIAINFNNLYLSCAPKSLLMSLPFNASGIAGLSRSSLAISNQFTSPHLRISKKFALCLPSSTGANGVSFFGNGPYYLLPPTNFDVSSILIYTPLINNPSSPGYYIGLNSISINGKAIRVPARKFKLDSLYHGGVKLSTVVPFTRLRSDIYKPFVNDFKKATRFIPRAKSVGPFGLCLNTSALGYTRVGLPVPNIDLGLIDGKNWTIFGSNSMTAISNDVACLAFVDGGKYASQAVVIGSFQIENNLLMFDLVESRLGFSSTLFFIRTTCGNFNFTTVG